MPFVIGTKEIESAQRKVLAICDLHLRLKVLVPRDKGLFRLDRRRIVVFLNKRLCVNLNMNAAPGVRLVLGRASETLKGRPDESPRFDDVAF